MATLYELTTELAQVAEALENDPNAEVQKIVEAIEGDIEAKVRNIAFLVENWKSDAEEISELVKKLQARKRARENAILRLKDWLKFNMEAADITKIESAAITVRLQAGQEKVVIDDATRLPDEFVRIEYRPNLSDIKAKLRALGVGSVMGAHLEPGESYIVLKT